MADLLGILVSGLMMLFIAFRAIQLDSKRPWFQPVRKDAPSDSSANPDGSGTARNSRPNGAR